MPGAIVSFVLYALETKIFKVLEVLFSFIGWFYLTLLPFIIQYFGIPLFVLGILMGLAFAGGTMVFTIGFFIFMYYFIKGTIFNSTP